MPANCVGALTQEWQLTLSFTTLSTKSFGHTEKPSRQPVIAYVLRPAVEQDQPVADFGIGRQRSCVAVVEHLE